MSTMKQKVSGCLRKAEYAQAYSRISSDLQTKAYPSESPDRHPNGAFW